MNISITGGDGFIGQHVRFFLLPYEKSGDVRVHLVPKDAFTRAETLASELSSADVVIHLAGMNRGQDDDVYATNTGIMQTLIEACMRARVRPHIIFASSTHAGTTSAYGRSKRDATQMLCAWGAREGARVAIVTMPHVFGPFSKPFYNSAVATLCHELAEGLPSEVSSDARVELIYANDVARRLYQIIVEKEEGDIRLEGTPMLLSDVYTFLHNAHELYISNVMPKMESVLERQLFGTLQSFVFAKQFPRALDVKHDQRGPIFEIVRSNGEGQIFFSTTRPGEMRGNHYHTRKFERFCVVQGQAEIAIRKLFTKDVMRYPVSGSNPTVIDMPQFHAHSLTNVGTEDLRVVFWISEHYNEHDSDTYHELV